MANKSISPRLVVLRYLRTQVDVDKVSVQRDGCIVVKRSYFYRHGMTAHKFALGVKSKLDIAQASKQLEGVKEISIFNYAEDWQTWPKTSYFVAYIRVT